MVQMLDNLDEVVNTLLHESYHEFVFANGVHDTLEEIEMYLGLRCEYCRHLIPELFTLIRCSGVEYSRLVAEWGTKPSCKCHI